MLTRVTNALKKKTTRNTATLTRFPKRNAAKKIAESWGWTHVSRNLFQNRKGDLRLVLTHHETAWFGVSFGTLKTLREDPDSKIVFVGPGKRLSIKTTDFIKFIGALPQSANHYNVNVSSGDFFGRKFSKLSLSVVEK